MPSVYPSTLEMGHRMSSPILTTHRGASLRPRAGATLPSSLATHSKATPDKPPEAVEEATVATNSRITARNAASLTLLQRSHPFGERVLLSSEQPMHLTAKREMTAAATHLSISNRTTEKTMRWLVPQRAPKIWELTPQPLMRRTPTNHRNGKDRLSVKSLYNP